MQKNKKEYSAIALPKQLIEELKLWRKAFLVCYPTRDVSYETVIRGMLNALELYEPEVFAEYNRMYAAAHPDETGLFKDTNNTK